MTDYSSQKWYVAKVRQFHERKVAEGLSGFGIETYVPVRKVRRKWSDRIKIVDQVLIPGMVFVHCNDRTRLESFSLASGIKYYLVDKAADQVGPLTVPDKQMAEFQKVIKALEGDKDNEITFVGGSVVPGDVVRVIRGPLRGRVFECVEVKDRHNLIIRMGGLGSFLVSVGAADVVVD